MNKIKNLLFDLGGVIMDIRRENAVEALTALGMKGADDFLGKYVQKGPFLMLEEGSITPAEFRDCLRGYFDRDVSDSDLDAAFCKFLTGIPEHRLTALKNLEHKGFRILMLSNTNPIMWNSEISRQFRKLGHDMDYYFDGTVTSFEAGVCKPDERIFRYALEKFGIKPEETLFLDDSAVNTETAGKLGFHTATVAPGTEFTDYI